MTIKNISAYLKSINEEIEADPNITKKHKWMIHIQPNECGGYIDYLELKFSLRRPVNVEVHSI